MHEAYQNALKLYFHQKGLLHNSSIEDELVWPSWQSSGHNPRRDFHEKNPLERDLVNTDQRQAQFMGTKDRASALIWYLSSIRNQHPTSVSFWVFISNKMIMRSMIHTFLLNWFEKIIELCFVSIDFEDNGKTNVRICWHIHAFWRFVYKGFECVHYMTTNAWSSYVYIYRRYTCDRKHVILRKKTTLLYKKDWKYPKSFYYTACAVTVQIQECQLTWQ